MHGEFVVTLESGFETALDSASAKCIARNWWTDVVLVVKILKLVEFSSEVHGIP
jgi:hypothetical protein